MRTAHSRILCVDNDPTTSDWIKQELRTSKIASSVTAVDGGRSALKLLFNEAFDLCVVDYALPDMTGAQLCMLMRQIGYSVPIMFFTALNRRIDRDKATSAGANEYLCKPDDQDIFATAAKRLLKMRRAIYVRNETISSLTKAT
jgi:CheY-like chemotaxis protein